MVVEAARRREEEKKGNQRRRQSKKKKSRSSGGSPLRCPRARIWPLASAWGGTGEGSSRVSSSERGIGEVEKNVFCFFCRSPSLFPEKKNEKTKKNEITSSFLFFFSFLFSLPPPPPPPTLDVSPNKTSPFSLSGAHVLITGGASGIGAALADACARRAPAPSRCSTRRAGAGAAAALLREGNPGLFAAAFSCDVTSAEQVER